MYFVWVRFKLLVKQYCSLPHGLRDPDHQAFTFISNVHGASVILEDKLTGIAY
jgi:hypothetical protein